MLCFDNNEGGVIKQVIGAIFVNISYLQTYFDIFTSAGGDISFLLEAVTRQSMHTNPVQLL